MRKRLDEQSQDFREFYVVIKEKQDIIEKQTELINKLLIKVEANEVRIDTLANNYDLAKALIEKIK